MKAMRYINPRTLPLVVTTALFILLFGFGAVSYDAFLSPQVFVNLIIDNGFAGGGCRDDLRHPCGGH
jgi:ABC-type xylose transport system permease subunit